MRTRFALLATALGAALAAAPAQAAADRPEGAQLYQLVTQRPEELLAALEDAFSRLLGSPEDVDVHVEYGRTSELLGGRFRKVSVRFEDGAIDLLKIKRARLEAFDVSYDLPALLSGETFLPRSVGSTRLDMTVTEDAMNEAVVATKGRLRVQNPRFELTEGRIEFRGRIKFLFTRQNLRLAGALKVRDGAKVDFRPSRIQVASISLPGFVVDSLARRFNPVLDLGRAAFWKTFQANLGEIDVQPGYLSIRTDPPPGAPFHRGPPAFAEGEVGPSRGEALTVLNSGIDPTTLD